MNRGPDGEPVAPSALVTCPLTTTVVKETGEVVTDVALKAALSQLPEPARAASSGAAEDLPPARRGLATAALDRAIGRCELCSEQLGEGEGRIDQRGGRRIVRCAPSCSERRQHRLEREQT